MANVLVIGGGGREHAICWKLSMSSQVKRIFVAPGSIGIAETEKVEIVSLNIKDHKLLCDWAHTQGVNMVIVGPEEPLASGIANALQGAGINCFGPTSNAAKIESDKNWAKEFMVRNNIPTARYASFTDPGKAKEFIESAEYNALVVKASGLAAGKGVIVAKDKFEACAAVDLMLKDHKFGNAGSTIVIEELLVGEEVSVLGFCDGLSVKAMLPAQDHKRALNDDKGNNTGGMGAYCPCPLLDPESVRWVEENILQKAVDGLRKENCPFVGVLYAGLMLTQQGLKVLEFNCRFGDPETEVILPLLEYDLYEIMMACCTRSLNKIDIKWNNILSSVGVVMSSRGYPESSSKGDHITGLDVLSNLGVRVFHCGIAKQEDKFVTNGGRVLINVCLAPSLITAAAKATESCSIVKFSGAHYRTDIAHKGIPRWLLSRGKLSYRTSGVDISAGDALIKAIKPSVSKTSCPAVLGSLGGFGALFDINLAGYKNPLLVSGTDGVGTKLKVAQSCNNHSTIGIDLVAMCVNDVLCHGAEPLFFLDYFACGKLDVQTAAIVIDGITEGCKMSGCALVGGETAEMPGLYKEGDYDLAGFVVGAIEKGHELPLKNQIEVGDCVIGLTSSGVHSNGFSLVRKVLDNCGMGLGDKSPFSHRTIGEDLLMPTKIYVKDVLPLVRKGYVKAIAHITGGGLVENIPRVLKDSLKVSLDASLWDIPLVFPWLAVAGKINESEMLRTFNCGIGLVLIVSTKHKNDVLSKLDSSVCIGDVHPRNEGDQQVEVKNFTASMEKHMKPFISGIVLKEAKNKRIGVLISGSGTNLQAVIDAIEAGSIDGEIVVVISNKVKVEGLNRAKRAGIPGLVVPHKNFNSREEFEKELQKKLEGYGVDFIVLAGFMRVLTGWFVSRWRGKMINVHPALLPSFKGSNACKMALEAGVRVTGCTVHFVEEGVDAGAVIVQEAVPIMFDDTEDSLHDRIRVAEHRALPKAVQLLCTGKVKLDLESGKAIWSN
ncbi:hypothetical protein AAG570_009918 [Ranatra chinensis]|uniref:Trifunctional purine biosynthetic protein adenosine-3 n=1 Tax=Ranatra chinensis TaxID=642074 RepID=A0ABD0YSM9_9HEMI